MRIFEIKWGISKNKSLVFLIRTTNGSILARHANYHPLTLHSHTAQLPAVDH